MSERVKLLLVIWALLIATVWVGAPFVRDMLLTADEPQTVVPRAELADFERISIEIFDATAPTVVYIFTETASTGVLGSSAPQGGEGSGFVWDGAGHVVTNFHVVQGADRIAVRLDSGEAIRAKLLGAAPDYDLAVLKLSTVPTGLRPVSIIDRLTSRSQRHNWLRLPLLFQVPAECSLQESELPGSPNQPCSPSSARRR